MIERTQAIPPVVYDPIEGLERHRSVPVDLETLRPRGLATDVGRFGFRLRVIKKADESRRVLLFPCWFVAAALMLLPARWLLLARARRRREGCHAGNLCPSCGYDLRATPSRCPEC